MPILQQSDVCDCGNINELREGIMFSDKYCSKCCRDFSDIGALINHQCRPIDPISEAIRETASKPESQGNPILNRIIGLVMWFVIMSFVVACILGALKIHNIITGDDKAKITHEEEW